MKLSKFSESAKIGIIPEKRLYQWYLRQKYISERPPYSGKALKDFDFVVMNPLTKQPLLVEVKYCKTAFEYKSVLCEYKRITATKEVFSGINVSTADYWWWCLGPEMMDWLCVERTKLIKYIEFKGLSLQTQKLRSENGDLNLCYIIPLRELMLFTHSTIINF